MNLLLLFSFSLIILSSIEAQQRIQIDNPKVVLETSKFLVNDRIHSKIVTNKKFNNELKKIISDFSRNYLTNKDKSSVDVYYGTENIPPNPYIITSNFQIELVSSIKGYADTFELKIVKGSKLDPNSIRESSVVCNLVLTKPDISYFYFAYARIKAEDTFKEACKLKRISILSRP